MSDNNSLSSRVMNMKFMRRAEIKQADLQQEEKQKEYHDLSEWKSPLAARYAKPKARAQVINVGYSSINAIGTTAEVVVEEEPKVGRKTWGDSASKEVCMKVFRA
ncbi:hypothetical protein BABINDRAFT_72772 [Babjeviella inositovora NRRL Y-12698]|uniref:Uncharacterized protein n=1 Tax=Babjeviella inositovora NRRL Y-12698 TaxID=984486 RepID=A0A1E3QXS0_9ASCO|nr:uncharacterized protein BABINDRAFT_72772 [Babjeviella inositovora NRRL Y-12698]ODQ82470.1 hypothetical protein BABINDRAFT_72772 [Babjeviella inositovora NRRL Y-12698]